MSNPPTQPKDEGVPVNDPIVNRMFDYTKWHIALHAGVLTLLAGGVVLKTDIPWQPLVSIGFLTIAGVAAGTLASALSRRERWAGFLQTRTWPLFPEVENSRRLKDGLTMDTWSKIKHAALWIGILWFVAWAIWTRVPKPDAGSESSKKAPPTSEPRVAAPPNPSVAVPP